MGPYIRRSASLKVLRQEGIDERFFQGQDYVRVPPPVTSILSAWCKDNGVANTALPSRDATSDEPQEVYYIELATKAGRSEFKAMLKALVPVLASSVAEAASVLTAKNFLAPQANGASDNLAAIVAFRDALLRFSTKPPKSTGADPVLIVGV